MCLSDSHAVLLCKILSEKLEEFACWDGSGAVIKSSSCLHLPGALLRTKMAFLYLH